MWRQERSPRYRVIHKKTGEGGEASAYSPEQACRALGLQPHECYILHLGNKPTLVHPLRYVRPDPKLIKKEQSHD